MAHPPELTALTIRSRNDKTGPIPVTTTARPTCAPGCPLAGPNGCYADASIRTRWHWDAVTDGRRGLPFPALLAALRRIRAGKPFRHNVAGDLWHRGGVILRDALGQFADAVVHLKAWTYTHHATTDENLATIREAVDRGFTVNLSTESRSRAAALHRLGFPVVCVVPLDAPPLFTYDGVRFRQCPATFDGSPTQCATCGGGTPLCARADRREVITFPVHGAAAAAAAASCS